jgi:DNA-binding HxlR family transcriptional regulator
MSCAHPHNLAIPKPKFSTDGLPEILRGKHKFRILWDLQFGSRRFGEIRKGLGLGKTDGKEVAPRVLSRELKSMVELGLIQRTAYNVIPPRVEYRLTSLGRSLLRAASKILEWGKRHPA